MPQTKTDYTNRNGSAQEQYTPTGGTGQSQPAVMFKRIGSTTYRVNVHFSDTSRETMDDKIVRLIRQEAVGQ